MKFEVGWSAVKMLLALSNFGHPGPARGALCGSGEPLRARAGPRRTIEQALRFEGLV
ncbi:hypothetical protein PCANC_13697 [Puccinia coronata f. sp. avenae]|uniref:Uncharacterized protein n=1 Tax=Puccinia coronata f. sp. avenae TaxID=200324 RepID=A0A2N5SQ62_9BASI|nr:hypothetical protein PCANC_13697 [Puccinia coronata f. sp. avenae]